MFLSSIYKVYYYKLIFNFHLTLFPKKTLISRQSSISIFHKFWENWTKVQLKHICPDRHNSLAATTIQMEFQLFTATNVENSKIIEINWQTFLDTRIGTPNTLALAI